MFYKKSVIILILSIFTFSCEKAKENIELPGKLLFEQDGYFFETKVKKLESDEFTPIFKFDESQIRYVRWSPDFSKILFLVNEYSADNQYKTNILLMNSDGTNKQLILSWNSLIKHASWSPDGNKITFDSNLDIYTVNIDGSNVTNLTNSETLESEPEWSPDGSRILFAQYSYDTSGHYVDNLNMYTLDTETLETKQITYSNNRFGEKVRWSPNGSKFAFIEQGEVAIINSDGTNKKILTNVFGWDRECENVSWSPDGQYLVYSYFGEVTKAGIIDLEGNEIIEVFSFSNVPRIFGPFGWKE